MHVWSYASRRIQSALEDLIAEGALADADATRSGTCGADGAARSRNISTCSIRRAPTMQIKDRNGETGFVGVKWRKPVAMLINEGTRSGKEVLAYGFKQYRLGELVGQRTEGAVLAATAFLIGDDGLLLLAVEDVLVDGQRLEGVGVTPTIEVPFDYRYAAGADPQLDRAVQVLAGAWRFALPALAPVGAVEKRRPRLSALAGQARGKSDRAPAGKRIAAEEA